MSTASDETDRLGPVEILIIEFPRGKVSGPGFATMTELVDRGVLAALDRLDRDPSHHDGTEI